MKVLDCKGLACPQPVILTKKELDNISEGELEVIVDNEIAKDNVSKFAKSQECEINVLEKDGIFHIVIKKATCNTCKPLDFNANPRNVILVTSDKFGVGDDKLGGALMKSYLYALSENDIKPESLIFVNGGVKLVVQGSEVLDSIKAIEKQGTEILACGTCLDFYNLKEKLAVGAVTNMYTIVEKTNKASNTIKL